MVTKCDSKKIVYARACVCLDDNAAAHATASAHPRHGARSVESAAKNVRHTAILPSTVFVLSSAVGRSPQLET